MRQKERRDCATGSSAHTRAHTRIPWGAIEARSYERARKRPRGQDTFSRTPNPCSVREPEGVNGG